MANSYKDLEKEFRGMDSEYREYLGMLGLRQVVNDSTDALYRRSPQLERGFDPVGNQKYGNVDNDQVAAEEINLTDHTMISLVDRMRHTTFKFKLMNAMHDIIDPLRTEMERQTFEDHLFHQKNHLENTWYQRSLLELMANKGEENEIAIVRGVLMGWKRFSRHPVWTSLRYTGMMVKGIGNVASTMLFGFKKEKNGFEKIVDAIKELTEFVMTGQIDKSESFMDKYIRKGLISSMTERVAGKLGYNIEGAQRNEDLMASGRGFLLEEAKKSMKQFGFATAEQMQLIDDERSSKLFKNIIKRGRIPKQFAEEKTPQETPVYVYNPYELTMLRSKEQELRFLESIAKTNALLLASTSYAADFSADFLKQFEFDYAHLSNKNTMAIESTLHNTASASTATMISQHKETKEFQEKLLDSSENVEKHTKRTARTSQRSFGLMLPLLGGFGGLGALLVKMGKGGLKRLPLFSLINGLLDTRGSNRKLIEELKAKGADAVEIGLSLVSNTARGVVGSVVDGVAGVGATAFDFVFGGDTATKLHEKFSSGFIDRLKNSPNFPFFGTEWWDGIFTTIMSDDFWKFEGSFVQKAIDAIKHSVTGGITDAVTAIDNAQYDASVKALAAADSMYDSMNDIFSAGLGVSRFPAKEKKEKPLGFIPKIPVTTVINNKDDKEKPLKRTEPMSQVQTLIQNLNNADASELKTGMQLLRRAMEDNAGQSNIRVNTEAMIDGTKMTIDIMTQELELQRELLKVNKDLLISYKKVGLNGKINTGTVFGIDIEPLLNKLGR
ncbi:hypothetical protein [Alishewanella phage vB_AspM_Slickus01]|nr:hypothetical protein [Alishewanella phage vB_AspM_Slickus01]